MFIQIPFFITAYSYLSNLEAILSITEGGQTRVFLFSVLTLFLLTGFAIPAAQRVALNAP
jgi:hypothetical protein